MTINWKRKWGQEHRLAFNVASALPVRQLAKIRSKLVQMLNKAAKSDTSPRLADWWKKEFPAKGWSTKS